MRRGVEDPGVVGTIGLWVASRINYTVVQRLS